VCVCVFWSRWLEQKGVCVCVRVSARERESVCANRAFSKATRRFRVESQQNHQLESVLGGRRLCVHLVALATFVADLIRIWRYGILSDMRETAVLQTFIISHAHRMESWHTYKGGLVGGNTL